MSALEEPRETVERPQPVLTVAATPRTCDPGILHSREVRCSRHMTHTAVYGHRIEREGHAAAFPVRLLGALQHSVRGAQVSACARPTRLQVAVWAVLLSVASGLALRNFYTFQVGTYVDDAQYVVLAQSLVASPVYGLVDRTTTPVIASFPFGFPLILAPLTLLGPNAFAAMKAVSLLATLFVASLIFWQWRWLMGPTSYWWALATTGLYVAAPLTVGHASMIMSEPVFTGACLAVLALARRGAVGPQPLRWSTLMALSLAAAVFTRTIGALLVPLVLAYLALGRGVSAWRPVLAVSIQIALMLRLIFQVTPLAPHNLLPSRYIEDIASEGTDGVLTSFVADPLWRVQFYFVQELPEAVLPFFAPLERRIGTVYDGNLVSNALGLLTLTTVIAGLVWLARRGLPPLPAFTMMYLAALFFWSWEGTRLLYPVQAGLFAGLLFGLLVLLHRASRIVASKRLHRRTIHRVLATFVLTMLAVSAVRSLRFHDSRLYTGDLRVRTAWTELLHAPSGSIMSEFPETDFLYSGRKMVAFPGPGVSEEQFRDYVFKNRVDYVLIAPEIAWNDYGYIASQSELTRKIAGYTAVLERQGAAERIYEASDGQIVVFRVRATQT